MVAMTIFALIMTALFLTFRTATKSYQLGIGYAEDEQQARMAMQLLAEDLRNVFYKPKNQYNSQRRQREQQEEQQRLQAEAAGQRYNPLRDPNAPALGPEIDLKFEGQAQDSISFVRQQAAGRSENRMLYGLARVQWKRAGNDLYRLLDDVTVPERDERGRVIEEKPEPEANKIASRVKSMSLRYGYWFEGEWIDTDQWDSEAETHRNPMPEEDERGRRKRGGVIVSQDPNQQSSPDDLPAWVEVTMGFADREDETRVRQYRQVIVLEPSQETFIPEKFRDGNVGAGGRSDRRSARDRFEGKQ